MGVLDDAIREHLELKRQHGAAEEEVQRQEEEALGPARRDVAQQHEEEAESAAAVAEADREDTALFDGGDAPAAEAPADLEQPAPETEPTLLHDEPVMDEPVLHEPPRLCKIRRPVVLAVGRCGRTCRRAARAG